MDLVEVGSFVVEFIRPISSNNKGGAFSISAISSASIQNEITPKANELKSIISWKNVLKGVGIIRYMTT